MALARVKEWVAQEVLTADDQNDEFDNILDNALSLISPLTGSLAAGGFDITGLDELALNDAATDASAAGRLRRNATEITWHDGTATYNLNIFRLLAVSNAEATSTSSSYSTFKTFSGLSIPVTSTVKLIFAVQKSAAADTMQVQILVNGATVLVGRTVIQNANAVGSGYVEVTISPQGTGYISGISMAAFSWDGTANTESVFGPSASLMPNAAITSIAIQAKNTGNAMTVALAQAKLYEIQGA